MIRTQTHQFFRNTLTVLLPYLQKISNMEIILNVTNLTRYGDNTGQKQFNKFNAQISSNNNIKNGEIRLIFCRFIANE